MMVKFPGRTIAEAITLGKEISRQYSTTLPSPMSLAYEKVYCPFLLQQTKHYAGVKYTEDDADKKLDVKGMESVRRDVVPLVQTLISEVLWHLLVRGDMQAAIQATKRTIAALLNDQIDMSQLIVTKALWRGNTAADYTAKQAHTELAERIKKRDPTRSIVPGQRLSFVYVQTGKGARQHEQSEEPMYSLQQGLPLDLELYLNNLLKKPLLRLFCLPGLLGTREHAEKALFTGEHMRAPKRNIMSPSKPGLSLYFQAKQETRCVSCRRAIQRKEAQRPAPGLCDECLPLRPLVMCRTLRDLGEQEQQWHSLNAQCARCQGHRQEIICTNGECRVFWTKLKVGMRTNSLTNELRALDW